MVGVKDKSEIAVGKVIYEIVTRRTVDRTLSSNRVAPCSMDSAVSAALSAALGTIQQGNNAPKIMHPSSSGSTPPSGTPPASSSVSHGPSGSGTVGKASSPDSALNIAQKTAVAQAAAAGPVPTVTTSVSGVQNGKVVYATY